MPDTLPPRFAPGTPGPAPQTIKFTASRYWEDPGRVVAERVEFLQ